ncbi:unnamed protein product, partial [Ilex paraguariensis]
WLTKRNKRALEKIKSELMLLGFVSLLLTVGQGPISEFCIPKSVGNSWHSCDKKQEDTKYKVEEKYSDDKGGRRLLAFLDSGDSPRRVLAAAVYDKCAAKVRTDILLLLSWKKKN